MVHPLNVLKDAYLLPLFPQSNTLAQCALRKSQTQQGVKIEDIYASVVRREGKYPALLTPGGLAHSPYLVFGESLSRGKISDNVGLAAAGCDFDCSINLPFAALHIGNISHINDRHRMLRAMHITLHVASRLALHTIHKYCTTSR